MKKIDEKIFLKCYNFSKKHKAFGVFAVSVTNSSSWIFFAFYAAFISALFFENKETDVIIKAFLIPAITVAVNLFLRKKIARKRPFDELGIEPLVPHGKAFSFPSNHSASALVIAVGVLNVYPAFGIYVAALAVITGLSRVFVGLHYPSDVLSGLFVGGMFGIVGFLL